MVQSAIPPGLQNPDAAVGGEPFLFGELLGWGACEAISGVSLSSACAR